MNPVTQQPGGVENLPPAPPSGNKAPEPKAPTPASALHVASPSLPPLPAHSNNPPVWPKSAQWIVAFLAGMVVTLLGYQAYSYHRFSTRPTDLERVTGAAYRLDLNRASHEELLQLPGVGDSMASRIEEYRKKRGKLRKVDELQQVHGIGPATMDRLRPWVDVEEAETGEGNDLPIPKKSTKVASSAAPASSGKKLRTNERINVNLASAEDLMSLEGIGPVTAQHIIEERAKRPFASVNELTRVPRLKGKSLDRIRPFVTVGAVEEIEEEPIMPQADDEN